MLRLNSILVKIFQCCEAWATLAQCDIIKGAVPAMHASMHFSILKTFNKSDWYSGTHSIVKLNNELSHLHSIHNYSLNSTNLV